jgi:anti-anti-sigma factor
VASSEIKITQARSGEVCVITLAGRIDSTNADEVMTQLNTLVDAGERSILIDFAAVLYLTSAAFRALLVATDSAERKRSRLMLCGVVGHVRELFEMGGLLDVFTIMGSREEALARLA